MTFIVLYAIPTLFSLEVKYQIHPSTPTTLLEEIKKYGGLKYMESLSW